MQYYFLLSALPPISLKAPSEMTFKELKEMLILNLTPTDLKKLRILLQPIDLYNVRAQWLGQPLDEKGNLTAKELEEALLVKDDTVIPPYLVDFLERYETTGERLHAFPSLYASLFRGSEEELHGFLGRYYQFERARMLILAALRAKVAGRDIVRELQFEDPDDPLVREIFAQKDAADFIPPKEFDDLKILFVENVRDPEKLDRVDLQYRLRKIEEMEEASPPFSIDRVLGYAARFLIIDKWAHLDREKGRLEVEKLSEYE